MRTIPMLAKALQCNGNAIAILTQEKNAAAKCFVVVLRQMALSKPRGMQPTAQTTLSFKARHLDLEFKCETTTAHAIKNRG
eukprot:1604992-Amphidinium_carterae.1